MVSTTKLLTKGAGNRLPKSLKVVPTELTISTAKKGIKMPERKKPTKAAPLAAPIFSPI